MREAMAASKDNYDKFIVDLRYNNGGYRGLLKKFLAENNSFLRALDTRILVGAYTFSSAIGAVDDLLYYINKITIYGSETGGIVGGFTDLGSLKLDKSGNEVTYSKLETDHYRLKVRKKQKDIWRGIIPDVEVVPTIEEYFSGYDAVYEKALE